MFSKKDVSSELLNKIKRDLKFYDKYHIWQVTFDKDEKEIFDECVRWFFYVRDIADITDFQSYKINQIGRFFGVWPVDIGNDYVNFSVDVWDEESWKDWFEIE